MQSLTICRFLFGPLSEGGVAFGPDARKTTPVRKDFKALELPTPGHFLGDAPAEPRWPAAPNHKL